MSAHPVLLAALLALVPVLGACEHPDPYRPLTVPDNPPLGAPPVRLTFNPEGDHWPAWLPDGSAIGYSYHPLERRDRDRCIAFIHPDGGRIFRQVCQHGDADKDSTNAVLDFGASPGGRIAVVAEAGDPLHTVPDWRYLYLGRLSDDGPVRALVHFPYITPSGRVHTSAAYLTWAGETTLAYLATYINYTPASINFPPDTVETGIELVRLDLSGDTAFARTIVPNTLGASSLARGPADTLYYTMGGDSRVFALSLGSGASSVVYDFGPLGIARDAHIEGGRLVAVVGGHVAYFFNPSFGISQQADSGGSIYSVTLPGGAPTPVVKIVPGKGIGLDAYRHASLAPSGRRVVAERFIMVQRVLRFTTDTVMNKQSDLWLFDVP